MTLDSVVNAADRLINRGPDEFGSWINSDRTVALAHRRLSVVGIDNGKQPIRNETGEVVAIVNGEFYDFRETRKQLESEGHRFQLDSDSEIVVHLYEKYGLSFVEHLCGEFAFLLWDENRKRLVAVRDRFGIKPLVYSNENSKVQFASQAKALLPELNTTALDLESFFSATSLQYIPEDRTLFAGIRQLPAGFMAIVDADGFRLQKYWDLDYPNAEVADHPSPPDGVGETDSTERTRKLLVDSVMKRMDADAPICFHLSGGIDSSCVLGIASRETGKQQVAYTICFDDQRYDEFAFANDSARFCNAHLRPIRMAEPELIENLFDAAKASEGLAINGHLSAKYLLNQAIRDDGFKVAMTGEGADEVFLGYAHLRMDRWNSLQESSEQQNLAQTNQSSVGMMLPFGDSLSTDGLRSRLGFVPSFLAAKATMGFRVRSLVCDDLLEAWKNRDAFAELADSAIASGQLKGRTSIHQSAWLWTKLALGGYILKTLGDGTEMAFSIEGRLPFLDSKLVEHVRRMRVDQLIRGKVEKFILREAVKPYVTEQVYTREKHPFDTPPLLLNSSGAIQSYLLDRVNSSAFRQQTIFDSSKVKALVEKIPSMDELERQVWDPVLILMVSTLANQELISESAESHVKS